MSLLESRNVTLIIGFSQLVRFLDLICDELLTLSKILHMFFSCKVETFSHIWSSISLFLLIDWYLWWILNLSHIVIFIHMCLQTNVDRFHIQPRVSRFFGAHLCLQLMFWNIRQQHLTLLLALLIQILRKQFIFQILLLFFNQYGFTHFFSYPVHFPFLPL